MKPKESKPRVEGDAPETESKPSDAETEKNVQIEIPETEPLITQGCSFDHKTGTIIINTRQVVRAFGLIDRSKIKLLKMTSE